MRGWLFGLLLAVSMCGTAAWGAEPFRIMYAEQVAVGKPRLARQLALHAYGREYDLRIESNDALARRLPLAALEGKALYRGTLNGVAGSWVRLAQVDGELSGAFWDGTDLYSVAPGRAVEPFLDTPLPQSARGATFVYKLSDTQGGVASNFCGAAQPEAARGAALGQYRALLAELKSLAADSSIPLQIEIALIGDAELNNRTSDPQGRMLSVINIVDGIFTAQVGVSIIPSELRVLDSPDNPLQSTDAPTLLEQLGTYRTSTPAVLERGLAHLLTGKELDGNIAGIAWLGALCEAETGVGLSEGWHDPSLSALIAAHELGHNFGSPHDAQAGSPCASTPSGFLMAPVVNFSSTFSMCSRQQMQPHIAAAACVVPLKVADVLPEVPAAAQVFVGEPFDIPIDVRSIGDLAAQSVQLRISNPTNLQLNGADTTAGTCAADGNGLACQLDTLAIGEVRRVTLHATVRFPGSGSAQVQTTASNDRNLANNLASISASATTPADIVLSAAPTSISGRVDTPIDFSFTLDSSGPRAARNVNAQIVIDDTQIQSATPVGGGSCAITGVVVNCQFGDLAAGASRRIDFTVQASRATGQLASMRVTADNDFNNSNDQQFLSLGVQAVHDLGIQPPAGDGSFIIDEPFDLVFVLRSTGLEASAPGTVSLQMDSSAVLTIESVTAAGGTCNVAGDTITCTFASLAAGVARAITIRAHGPQGVHFIRANVDSADDDVPDNNFTSFQVIIKPAVNVGIVSISSNPIRPFVDVPFIALARLQSVGVQPATNVTVRTEIPTQFQIRGATLEGGSCSIAAQIITCTRATLAVFAEAMLRVDLLPLQSGDSLADLTVEATGDTPNFDNLTRWIFEARDGVDLAIEPPASPVTLFIGVPQTVPITVRNGRVIASSVVVRISGPDHVILESATVAGGNCLGSGNTNWNCFLGSMAPHEVRQVDLRVRAPFMAAFALNVQSETGSFDVNPPNDDALIAVGVTDRQGDAATQLSAATASGQLGQAFDFPIVTIAATAPVDDARVQITVDNTLAGIGTHGADGGVVCSVARAGTLDTMTCLLGTIEPGAARSINLRLSAVRAGSFVSTVTFGARNDTNFANNVGQVTVEVTSPPPPPPPPPSSGGSGGGGGGSMSLYWLLLLLALRWFPLTSTHAYMRSLKCGRTAQITR